MLGPLLFIIFIDGVNSASLSACSHLSLNADDMLVYKLINSASDYDLLQEDIDALDAWVSAHFLSFNPSKCKYMLVSRKLTQSDPPALLLSSTAIERVDSFKYLGVTLSSNLSWSDHVDLICASLESVQKFALRMCAK